MHGHESVCRPHLARRVVVNDADTDVLKLRIYQVLIMGRTGHESIEQRFDASLVAVNPYVLAEDRPIVT